MATAKHSSSSLRDKDTFAKSGNAKLSSSIYEGIIKDNRDPLHSGRLWVWIPELGGSPNDKSNWHVVRYASPFHGMTSAGSTPSPDNAWDKTMHSYGMWAVPPDLDNHVLIAFAMGDPNRGYWFACVPSKTGKHMVPGIASSDKIDTTHLSSDLNSALTGNSYPVTDYNEYDPSVYAKMGKFKDIKKPIHEAQVRILLEQGLQDDFIRGQTTSSAERESPSYVFGFSTPGRDSGNQTALTPDTKSPKYRLGGHQFVLDDGDSNGDNNLIKLRSAGGHQIILHDSENVIYISNANGTTWIEMTSDGTTNIYSESDYSLRTKGNLNMHADTDINFHAGNDINIYAVNNITTQAQNVYTTGTTDVNTTGGKIEIVSNSTLETLSKTDTSLSVGDKMIISSGNDFSVNSGSNFTVSSSANSSFNAGSGFMVSGSSFISFGCGGSGTVLTPSAISIGSSAVNLNGLIGMNAGGSIPPSPSPSSGLAANPIPAPILIPIKFIDVIKSGLKWVQKGSGKSIITTVPTHEPWILHGSSNSQTLSPSNTQQSQQTLDSQDPTMSQSGPKSTIGSGVQNPVSANDISAQPPTSLQNGLGSMSAANIDALKAQIGKGKSYTTTANDQLGNISSVGKYAINSQILSNQGYIASPISNLSDTNAWTGKNGITSVGNLTSSANIQENIMDSHLNTMYNNLNTNGTLNKNSSAGVISGCLAVSHSIGETNTANWVNTGYDPTGTAKGLFNQGRYAATISSPTGQITGIPTTDISSVVGGIPKTI